MHPYSSSSPPRPEETQKGGDRQGVECLVEIFAGDRSTTLNDCEDCLCAIGITQQLWLGIQHYLTCCPQHT